MPQPVALSNFYGCRQAPPCGLEPLAHAYDHWRARGLRRAEARLRVAARWEQDPMRARLATLAVQAEGTALEDLV